MDTLKKENKEVHERLQALGDEKDKVSSMVYKQRLYIVVISLALLKQ